MPRSLRQRITRALQTTFRSSSPHPQSALTPSLWPDITIHSETKPIDGGYIPHQFRTPTVKNDYIDLSECHSSYSKDSGISSNESHDHLESTRIHSAEVASYATISNLSPIPSDQKFVPTSFQCCRCQCHHYTDQNLVIPDQMKYVYRSEDHQHKKLYPFIF